jgi:hypothetical protein
MPGMTARQHFARRKGCWRPKIAGSIMLSMISVAWFGGCASMATTPMSQPEEVMKAAWGPFARQCTTTRTSHLEATGRSGPNEVATSHESCIGFAATPAAGGAIEITGSTTSDEQPASPVLLRILRSPNGVSRPAAPGDTGLLAQGSDNKRLAEAFARQIGLMQQQVIAPTETLDLPISLYVPSPVEGMLQCHPDGGRVDRGRETLVFSCTMDEQVHTDRLDARLRLDGVEEVDVLTGVRLSGSFAGSMRGRQRVIAQARVQSGTQSGPQASVQGSAQGHGRAVDDHIWYERTTEFE